jgi:hypothetical protein
MVLKMQARRLYKTKGNAMKATAILASICIIAIISSTANAGSPDSPGIGGRLVSEMAKLGEFGEIISGFVHADPPELLGPTIQDLKDISGGSPNPANDRGRGNDDGGGIR